MRLVDLNVNYVSDSFVILQNHKVGTSVLYQGKVDNFEHSWLRRLVHRANQLMLDGFLEPWWERTSVRKVDPLFTQQPQVKKTKSAPVFEGQACTTCGNFNLVRSGTCLTCTTCGTTTGCS